MKINEWFIELQGRDGDIEFLEQFLAQSPFRIVDGPIAKMLTLPGLPPDAESEAVRLAANRLIEIINGAARLYNDRLEGVSFVKVSRLGDDGKWHGYGYVTAGPRSTQFMVFREGDETLSRWVSAGLIDDAAARALGLYGSLEPNWKNLYLVFDTIVESVGRQAELESKGWAPSSHIRRFKQTANSYRAIGREARHAKMSYQPPSQPMSLKDAHELIRTILAEWINWRESQSS